MNSVRDVAGRTSVEVLRLVRSLVGVADAAVRAAPDGRADAIAVLPEPDAHERQVRLNVASALMAGFGMALDPAKIHIAADAAGLRAFAPEPRRAPAPAPEPVQAAAPEPAHDWPAPVRDPVAPAVAPTPRPPLPGAEPAAPAAPARGAGNGAHTNGPGNGGHPAGPPAGAARPNGGGYRAAPAGFPIAPPRRVRLAEDVAGNAPGIAAPAPPQPAPPERLPERLPEPVRMSDAGMRASDHPQPAAPPPPAPHRAGNGGTGNGPRPAEPLAPATMASGDDAPADGHPRLEAAELVTTRGITLCRVVIVVAGERYAGVAEVQDGQTASVELVARITADALRSARFPREPVQYQGAATVDLGGRTYVVAALRAWNGRAFNDLTAAEPVADAPEEAAARAVLRAAAASMT